MAHADRLACPRRATDSDADGTSGTYDDDWELTHNATHCYCADRYAGSVDTAHSEGYASARYARGAARVAPRRAAPRARRRSDGGDTLYTIAHSRRARSAA